VVNALAQIDDEYRDGLAIARVRGEIDASNAAWIGAKLRGMLSNHSRALAVDLSETRYLDSAGIALVFSLASELRLHQQELHLVVVAGSPIARMIGLAGVDGTVPTHATLEDAVTQAAV
jgi:anti-sigma B factor antagonist